MRGPDIVGVLDDLGEPLEPIARQQAAAAETSIQDTLGDARETLECLTQLPGRRPGFGDIARFVGGLRTVVGVEQPPGGIHGEPDSLTSSVLGLSHVLGPDPGAPGHLVMGA